MSSDIVGGTVSASGAGAPTALRDWITTNPRNTAIHDHGFTLNTGWWNDRIVGLPGAPIAGGSRSAHITRADLFAMADRALADGTGTGALQLLWHTLVWGSGSDHRRDPRRIASIRENPEELGKLLRDAAERVRTDVREAFLMLKPGRPAIKFLGPNFFTKFLYFAGGGDPTHRALIVDRRVRETLHRVTGHDTFRAQGNYRSSSYLASIETMEEWAADVSSPQRRVAADEVERWAFSAR
ncbi:hypothetical protein ACMX2H_13195 [Arthrobacter sulfonylureivorans]|uniref:8-oxoguanine DNA glycosylase OGG fold protein n=1 Tax=Arthrobacter sulfonylureivorans TaxID=2486855 RepID=UPI0039E6A966